MSEQVAIQGNEIFRYQTPSGANRYAEPIACLRKLVQFCKGHYAKITATAGNITAALERMEREAASGTESEETALAVQESISAIETLRDAYLYAFGLPAFNETTGEGCTTEFCVALHNEFTEFLDRVKKNTVTTPS